MPDYYIRTPDHDESRGPFDPAKLETLAESGQINPNTLYYDEEKEEWIPIAINEDLHASVFPQKKKLSLKIRSESSEAGSEENLDEDDDGETGGLDVETMLDAAEGRTEEKKAYSEQRQSFERATALASPALGLMLLLSAAFMMLPLQSVFQSAYVNASYTEPLNYPTILIGLFDLIMGLLLLLGVSELFPVARARGMLTLGFGLYVGWSIGDPIFMGVSTAAGLGIFLATIAQSTRSMLLAIILGVGGHAYLTFLAATGRFEDFFDGLALSLF